MRGIRLSFGSDVNPMVAEDFEEENGMRQFASQRLHLVVVVSRWRWKTSHLLW
jgi:hypothetical protein